MKRLRFVCTLSTLIISGLGHQQINATEMNPFNWKILTKIVTRSTAPETVAALLLELNKQYPGFTDHYALVHSSGSLQSATPANPRAIVFSSNGELVLTFNGDPTLKGYGSVEVMHFDETAGKYEFRDIIFLNEAHGDDAAKLQDSEIEIRTKTHIISKSNPGICMDCHSIHFSFDPKPIWASYFLWPGVFGAEDDRIYSNTVSRATHESKTQGLDELILAKDKVKKDFLSYQKTAADPHSRYFQLKSLDPEKAGTTNEYRPNGDLSAIFNRQMGNRAARQVYEHPSLFPYRYLIFSIYLCPAQNPRNQKNFFEGYFPKPSKLNSLFTPANLKRASHNLNRRETGQTYTSIVKILKGDYGLTDEELKDHKDKLHKYSEHKRCSIDILGLSNTDCPQNFMALLFEALDLNLGEWSANIDGVFSEEYEGNSNRPFNASFIESMKMREQSSSEKSPVVNRARVGSEEWCSLLKEASIQSLR